MIAPAKNSQTILVTDAGRGTAIAMIRSLGERGYRVVAADSDPWSVGFRSRYAVEQVVYPDPARHQDEFIDVMYRAVREQWVDLVIPVTDDTLLPLSDRRELFSDFSRLALPSMESLEMTTNKLVTLELAQRLGVSTPRTVVVNTVDEALRSVKQFRWPVVLKPAVSRLYHGHGAIEQLSVSYADDESRLARKMSQFEGRTSVLMQEYVSGTGYGVEMLLFEGRPLAAFQHRRLREIPISGGASSFRESTALNPVMFDSARRLLEAIRWTGLAMVEFKSGPEGVKLMEINGRPWGSFPLAVRSGMDFPALLADLFLNGPPQNFDSVNTNYQAGVRSRNLELDLMWISTVLAGRRRYPYLPTPGRSEAIAALCGLFNPANKLDIQSFRDPWPGLAEIPKVVRKLIQKLCRETSDVSRSHLSNSPLERVES